MVPGYVIIIPFQDVTKQQQQQPNRLLIRLIPAVINLPITAVTICSISTSLNISLHFITTFLPTTNQPPFGNLEIQQTLATDQQPTYLLTIQNIQTFTTTIKRNITLVIISTNTTISRTINTTISRKFQFLILVWSVVGIVDTILSALCARIMTTLFSILFNIGHSQTQQHISRHLTNQLLLPLLILLTY